MSRMILNETSYFGPGAISNIVGEIEKRKFKKALVVTDADLVKLKVIKPVIDLLEKAKFQFEIFDQVEPNPSVETVKKGVAAFKKSGADSLITIGGGSPQDACKAIGIIIANPEFSDVLSLEGGADTKNPSVPVIAIPTTAGTAAEITINYVITDTQKRRKFVCWDPHAIPKVAIVDSDLMKSMPPSLKAATGIDALTHAIEGLITKGAWVKTDMYHLEAIKLIAQSLRASVKGDAKGGETMALAQYIAGMGFSNAGLGLVHAMAHPLGAFYDTPHGVANAVLLPHIMEYNAEYTGEKFREVAKVMGVQGVEQMSLKDVRKAAVNAVAALCKDVGIPPRLREVGMKESDVSALAQSALADVCTPGNPRPVKLEDVQKLYRDIY